jgi:hypothetical protein
MQLPASLYEPARFVIIISCTIHPQPNLIFQRSLLLIFAVYQVSELAYTWKHANNALHVLTSLRRNAKVHACMRPRGRWFVKAQVVGICKAFTLVR